MRFLMRMFAKLRTLVGRPGAYAAAEWNRMSARERRLISILGGAFAGCAVLVIGYLVFDSMQTMSQDNQDMRDALDAIAKHSDEYRDAKARASCASASASATSPRSSPPIWRRRPRKPASRSRRPPIVPTPPRASATSSTAWT